MTNPDTRPAFLLPFSLASTFRLIYLWIACTGVFSPLVLEGTLLSDENRSIRPLHSQNQTCTVQASPLTPTDTAAQVDLSDGVLYCFGYCTLQEQNQMIQHLINRDHHEQSQDKPN